MSAYLFSAAQAETLYRLMCHRTHAAGRPEPEPVDGTYAIMFNPTSGRFDSRLIPNHPTPAEPAPLQDLGAAGFVSLLGIPQYRRSSDGRRFSKPDFRQVMLALELETRHQPQAWRFSAWAWLTQGEKSPRLILKLLLGR